MSDLFPLLGLLLVAIGVGIVAARFRIPYTIGLVVFGFALGVIAERTTIPGLSSAVASLFTPTFFFDVLLPPIIFEAAIHVNFRYLWAHLRIVLFLVLGGVLFTTVFTGVLVGYLTAIPLTAALLLAAILSPTDPIAVVDMFRRLRVPEELSTIVESESILNDAVGVVLFVVLLGLVETGSVSVVGSIFQFLWLVGGGIGVGLLAAGGLFLLHRRLNDASVETALTVVAAFGSFLLATDLGASGIIATAITGIAVGSWVAPRAMESAVREVVNSFWGVLVYIVNSLVFLSIGLLFTLTTLITYLPLILLVSVLLVLGRAIFVYAYRLVVRRSTDPAARLPSAWYGTITLAGVRGVIPVVLALSLLTTTTTLPDSTVRTILAVVLGVAFLSVVVNNLVAEYYVDRHFATKGEAANGSSPTRSP